MKLPALNLTNALIAVAIVVLAVKFSAQIKGLLGKIPVIGGFLD